MKKTFRVEGVGEQSVTRFVAPFFASYLRRTATTLGYVEGDSDWQLTLSVDDPLFDADDLVRMENALLSGATKAIIGGASLRKQGGIGTFTLLRARQRATTALLASQHYETVRHIIVQEHMESGVVILSPQTVTIEAGVTIAPGAVIYPGNTIMGNSSIAKDAVILPNCRLEDATVGEGTSVGPCAYLRPNSRVGKRCKIGDFVEIKNSTIGDDTHIAHLTYVGDSDLGARINLGCGVVFVNYDGKEKHRSTVGDDAFIGCNVNLISPVAIGTGAYIAAGSTITRDVPDGAFAIARERETVKEGWATERRLEGKL